jgi:hypothetical protein
MTIEFSTRSDCTLDLTMSYGRFAGIRLTKAINEREQELDRRLSRDEVLDMYHEIDQELSRTLLTRQGK